MPFLPSFQARSHQMASSGGGGEYTPLMMQLQEMKNADDVEEIILAEDRSDARDLEAGLGDAAAALVCQANCLTDPQVNLSHDLTILVIAVHGLCYPPGLNSIVDVEIKRPQCQTAMNL